MGPLERVGGRGLFPFDIVLILMVSEILHRAVVSTDAAILADQKVENVLKS